MALSEELPLYRDTYRLLNNLLILTQDFPRFFRYSMGSRTHVADAFPRMCGAEGHYRAQIRLVRPLSLHPYGCHELYRPAANAAYLAENPIAYIIFPESIHNRVSFAIFAAVF